MRFEMREDVVKEFAIIMKDGSEVRLTFDINLTMEEAELVRMDMDRPLNKDELGAVEKIIKQIKEGYKKLALKRGCGSVSIREADED